VPRFPILMALLGLLTATVSAPAAAAEPKVAAESKGYVLGPNDVITVQVFGQPDAGVSTRIKPDGTIVMPLIGTIRAEGLTSVGLADTITKKFVSGGFFKAPFVNVEIGTYVSRTVNVAGKVGTPGVFPLDKDYHVLEMLLKAGWVREGTTYVYLRRGSDYKEVRLDTDALVRGGKDADPLLEPGDTLFVPDADTFYIYGQISHPGVFPIVKGMTLRQALAISGGVTAAGSEHKVALLRGNAKEVDAVLDQPIQKNDVYIVKERLF